MDNRKTLEQLIIEMENLRLAKKQELKEQEEREKREAAKKRREYIQRNKMFEYVNPSAAASSNSAGGGSVNRQTEKATFTYNINIYNNATYSITSGVVITEPLYGYINTTYSIFYTQGPIGNDYIKIEDDNYFYEYNIGITMSVINYSLTMSAIGTFSVNSYNSVNLAPSNGQIVNRVYYPSTSGNDSFELVTSYPTRLIYSVTISNITLIDDFSVTYQSTKILPVNYSFTWSSYEIIDLPTVGSISNGNFIIATSSITFSTFTLLYNDAITYIGNATLFTDYIRLAIQSATANSSGPELTAHNAALANYDAADTNEWVIVSDNQYQHVAAALSVDKRGISDEHILTRTGTGWNNFLFNGFSLAAGEYLIGYIAETWNGNATTYVGYTTGTSSAAIYPDNGALTKPTYKNRFIRKAPSGALGAPATETLYPVIRTNGNSLVGATIEPYTGFRSLNNDNVWEYKFQIVPKFQWLVTNNKQW